MKSWHLISVAFIATAALSFYNNDFKISAGIVVYSLIAVGFYIANRNRKEE
jgi:hypothetical protein